MKQKDFSLQQTKGASVIKTDHGYKLAIPASGKATGSQFERYRLAQIDDYFGFPRRKFPHHSITLSLRARASSNSIPGTWGFGVWNDPFGLSIGFGGSPFRLPALPNAIWFFHASKESYLSFSEKPGNGFLVQAFRSPAFPFCGLVKAGMIFPFSREKARKLLCKIVEEEGVRLDVDMTEWHAYRLEWSPKRSAFWVDGALVLETPISPHPPLGLVIWIDNQYAAWHPDGKIGFGILGNAEPAWLEVKDLNMIE